MKKMNKKNESSYRNPKGDEELLGTDVFDYGKHNQNQYNKTLEAILSLIGRTFSQPGNTITSIRKLEKVTLREPSVPTYISVDKQKTDSNKQKARKVNHTLDLKYVEELKNHNKEEQVLKANLELAYSLVWGQCTPAMQAQLKTMANYLTIREKFDVFELLKEIKGHTFKLTDHDYPFQSVWDSYQNVFNMMQGSHEFLDKFQERFNIVVEAAEGYGCIFGSEEILWETDPRWKSLSDLEKADPDEREKVQSRCREALLSYSFTQALSDRYDAYKKSLRASYSQGDNRYKGTVIEAYQMALDVSRIYQKKKRKEGDKSERQQEREEGGASFVQRDEKKKPKGQCFKCGAKDYKTCPCDNLKKKKDKEKETKAESHAQKDEEKTVRFDDTKLEASFHQIVCYEVELSASVGKFCNREHDISLAGVILMDSGSTIDLIQDKRLLKNISKGTKVCKIKTNGGILTTDMVRTLEGFGEVWYHPEALTNILSLRSIKSKFRVTFDSDDEDCFVVHKPGEFRKFCATSDGLYVMEVAELLKKLQRKVEKKMFLQTVEDNKKGFSKRAIQRTSKAKELYGMIQYPSIKDFKEMLRHNMIKNCPVKVEDVDTMLSIYGPNIYALKGKTVRKKSPPVGNPDYIKIPDELNKYRKKLVLEADVIYLNGLTFWFTMARKFDLFCTCQ